MDIQTANYSNQEQNKGVREMIAYGSCGFCKICDQKTSMIRAVDNNGNYYCQSCYTCKSKSALKPKAIEQQLRKPSPTPTNPNPPTNPTTRTTARGRTPTQRRHQANAKAQQNLAQRQAQAQQQQWLSNMGSYNHGKQQLANGNQPQPEKEKTLNEKYPDIRSKIPKYSELED